MKLNPPSIPVMSSPTGTWMRAEEATDPGYWATHLRKAVRFGDGLQQLLKSPAHVFLEIGPGNVLSSLAKHPSAKAQSAVVLCTLGRAAGEQELATMLATLGQLWLEGTTVDWSGFYSSERRHRIDLPTYPFERKRYWIEPTRLEPAGVAPTERERQGSVSSAEAPKAEPAEGVSISGSGFSMPPDQQESLPKPRKELIAQRVQNVLRDLSGAEDIDCETPFLTLGFDSLFLAQACLAFEKEFKVKVTLRQLVESHSTIGLLSAFLDSTLAPDSARTPQPGSESAAPEQTRQMLPSETKANASEKSTSSEPGPAKAFGPFKQIDRAAMRNLSNHQQQRLDDLTQRYNQRTAKSKAQTQGNRAHFADPRAISGFRRAWKEMVYPIVASHSAGSKIWDVDDNEYVDFTMGFGIYLFGHSPGFVTEAIADQLRRGTQIGPQSPLAGHVAEKLCELTGMERATFCNTGSEAVLAALRVARAVTGRKKVVLFAGSYHGINDEVLVRSHRVKGQPRSFPIAPGIPAEAVGNVLVLDYGDPASLDRIRSEGEELAAVLVEPVQSRHPDLQPREFLRELREITDRTRTALIFDEVVTGFRLHPGGAQAYYGVQADLATYGKVIGGGMPIGVLAGRAQYLNALDGGPWRYGDDSVPEAGVTFFAGTFVRHPLALAASAAVLAHLEQHSPALQQALNARADEFARALNAHFKSVDAPVRLLNCGSMFCVRLHGEQEFGGLLFCHLREKNVHIWEGRPCFLSTAHSEADIEHLTRAFKQSVEEMQEAGFLAPVRDIAEPAAHTSFPKLQSSPLGSKPESLSLTARPAEGPLPLTPGQIEIWLAAQLGPQVSSAYLTSISVSLRGDLNLPVLKGALQKLVDRHDGLRMVFAAGGESQKPSSNLSLEIPLVDLTNSSTDQLEQQVARYAKEAACQPFELTAGPLVRVKILQLREDHYVLLLTAHHIICDGWSVSVMLQELAELYSAGRRGVVPSLPEPLQFSEYVRSQLSSERKAAEDDSTAYWMNQFGDRPPVLDLPKDRPRPSIRSYQAGQVISTVSTQTLASLRALSRQQNCTLFTLLLSCFEVFLHRLSGEPDIVVGIPAAGQAKAGDRPLIGHCVSLLPLRSRVEPSQKLSEFLLQTRKALLDAYDHQETTLGSIIQKLNLPREVGRMPLVAVTFNLDRTAKGLSLADLEVDMAPNPKSFINFDFMLNLRESEKSLRLECDYDRDLFDPQTVERWMEHLQVLLEQFGANLNKPVHLLPLLSARQREQILVKNNRTQVNFPQAHLVDDLFRRQIERTPDAVAVESGNESFTYRELDTRVSQVASHLQSLGVGTNERVGLCLERSTAMVVGLLGIVRAGGAYVPLDPEYPKDRLEFILKDAGVRYLLTQSSLGSLFGGGFCKTVLVDELKARSGLGLNVFERKPEHLAYVIYTSGSTGRPKGVLVTQGNLLNLVLGMQDLLRMDNATRVLSVASISFDIGTADMFLPLLAGGTLRVASRDTTRDGQRMREELDDAGITFMQATPQTWRLLLESGWKGNDRLTIVSTGEPLPDDLKRELYPKCKHFWNLYGPTETTIWSTAVRMHHAEGPVSIGYPIANTQILIVDRSGELCPTGVPGELLIGGAGLAAGYLNRPELTAERFVRNSFPEIPSERLYRTGDLTRWLPDGTIEHLGRLDHQVKLRGYRIELEEIEVLLREAAGVREAAVVVVESANLDRRLVAYVVAASKGPATEEALQAHLRKRLPEYMIPSAMSFLESLPLTPNGKIDRKVLAARKPETRSVSNEGDAPVRTLLEFRLIELWEKVLGRERVRAEDNFFENGGHSMLAVRLMAELEKLVGKRMPLATLFHAPSPTRMAEILAEKAITPPWSSLVPLQPLGKKPPIFFFHGWGGEVFAFVTLAKLLGKNQPVYGLQAVGLESPASRHKSVEEMAAHYIKEVRALQPRGPYYFAGYSMGGMIALEAAQQLRAEGADVALLALVDTVPVNVPWRVYLWMNRLFFVRRLQFHARRLTQATGRDRRAYTLKCLQSFGAFVAANTKDGMTAKQMEKWESAARKRDYFVVVGEHYRPKPYSGSIVFFSGEGMDTDPLVGWRYLVHGGITVQQVKGRHKEIINTENVEGFAATFRKHLLEAQSRSGDVES